MSAVDVLAVMDAEVEAIRNTLPMVRYSMDAERQAAYTKHLDDLIAARAAVAELIERTERVATTLEMPTLVKQSTKNANAGFIDWRDWMVLRGEVDAMRAALIRCGGTP